MKKMTVNELKQVLGGMNKTELVKAIAASTTTVVPPTDPIIP